jgi:hypothetical protein
MRIAGFVCCATSAISYFIVKQPVAWWEAGAWAGIAAINYIATILLEKRIINTNRKLKEILNDH